MDRRTLFGCLLLLSFTRLVAVRAEVSKEIEAKVALESSIETRLQNVLRRMLGSQDVIVIVNVQLAKEDDSAREILPGVPLPQNPATPGALGTNLPNVRRLFVTILLGETASDQEVKTARDVSARLLGIDPDKADLISIQKIKFQKPAEAPAPRGASPAPPSLLDLARPGAWVPLLWLALAVAAMILSYRRVLSPLLSLLRDMINLRQKTPAPEPSEGDADMPRPSAALPTVQLAAAAEPAAARGESAARPDAPFSFVQERDVARLIYLLRKSDPKETAVVLHYIPPALGSQVLASLETPARRKVAALLATVRQFEESDVRPLEEALRKRIGYLIGGEDKIADLLDQLPPGVQSDLLETLSRSDPSLTARLSRRLVMLEDLAALETADLKMLSRRVPVQTLAAVLRPAPDLQRTLLPKLSEGLRDWLTQEIELSSDLPADALDAERRRVLTALSQLVREGRVLLRKSSPAISRAAAEPMRQPASGARPPETAEIRTAAPTESPSRAVAVPRESRRKHRPAAAEGGGRERSSAADTPEETNGGGEFHRPAQKQGGAPTRHQDKERPEHAEVPDSPAKLISKLKNLSVDI